MKVQLLATLALLTTAFTLSGAIARAGGADSGGGKGVVCRDSNGNITSAEILDFWEAREIYRLPLQPTAGTMKEMLDASLKSLSQTIVTEGMSMGDYKGADALDQILRSTAYRFLRPEQDKSPTSLRRLRNARLVLTNDSYEAAVPGKCAIEQIVRYEDYDFTVGAILLDQDIFDHLDPMNQAGLLAHEAFYKYLRDTTGELTSLRVRRSVGLAFSGYKFSSLSSDKLPAAYYVCHEIDHPKGAPFTGTTVYMYPITYSSWGQTFTVLVAQATEVIGLSILDTSLFTNPPAGALLLKDLKNLSSIKGYKNRIQVSGLTQPELKIDVQVERAWRGKAEVLITAKPSAVQPNQMRPVKASCTLVTKKK